MPTIALSENAVAALRFEIRGFRPKDLSRRLPAYRELSTAGIMESVPGSEMEYRFTEYGLAHGAEVLERESSRIERERHAAPDTSRLSAAAWGLLRRLSSGEEVEVNEATRPAYRELVAAGIMIPGHSFVGGWDQAFRFTYWGWERRSEWLAAARETA